MQGRVFHPVFFFDVTGGKQKWFNFQKTGRACGNASPRQGRPSGFFVSGRNVDPAVVSVTRMNAGTNYNVIPESVAINGTVRYFDPKVQDLIDAAMKQVVEGIAFMLRKKPGAYIHIGMGETGVKGLHHPEYDFNDALLPIGIAYWVKLTERLLK